MNFRAINLTCICVDAVRLGEIDGRLYHRYSTEPAEFLGISGLLSSMESFFDEINFPQAAMEQRRFRNRKGAAAETAARLDPVSSWEAVTERRGKKATFLIQVRQRQNASWQGDILWAERDITQHFLSVLELLKLIDSCVTELLEEDAGALALRG